MKKSFTFLGAVFLTWVFVATAWSAPVMKQVKLQANDQIVTMDGNLDDALTENLIEALHSGVPLTFTFDVHLLRKASLYPDKVISKNHIVHTVSYDTLKKTYEFSSEGINIKRKVVTKKPELYKQLLLTLKDIPLSSINTMDPDEEYYVRVKAEMETDEGLWFPFNLLFFFVPFNEFETSWAESETIKIDPNQGFPVEATETKKESSGLGTEQLNDGARAFNQ